LYKAFRLIDSVVSFVTHLCMECW